MNESLMRRSTKYPRVESWAVKNARCLVAVVVIAAIYWQAQIPESLHSSTDINQRFRFDLVPLFPGVSESLIPGPGVEIERVEDHDYFVRKVHPSLYHIRSWISSVGAAVALSDLAGRGLCSDAVHVDPRTNRVIVGPVPNIAASRMDYAPFVLPSPDEEGGKSRDSIGSEGSDTTAPMGTIVGDFDEDGNPDILVYYWGRSPVIYLRNPNVSWPSGNSSANDVYVPQELCVPTERWFTNSVTQADLDGDGHIDVIIGNYFPDYAHVLNPNGTGTEAMQDSMSAAHNGGRNRFFLWAKSDDPGVLVRFREAVPAGSEVAPAFTTGVRPGLEDDRPTITMLNGSGQSLGKREVDQILCGWTLAIGAGDLDGDLYPEVYFANDFGPDRLLYNQTTRTGALRFILLEGRRTLTTPKSKILGHDSFKGMGVAFVDLNKDGIPDICVSNIASKFALEESHHVFVSQSDLGSNAHERRAVFGNLGRIGVAPYRDRSEELGLSRTGWAWDWKFASFDNDLDLQGIQATGFIRGHSLSTSFWYPWLHRAGLIDPAQGLIKGVRDRWPVLHELATGNDQRVSNPLNWAPMRPGDDLSGHQRNAFFVLASDGRYYDVAEGVGLEKDFEDSMVSRGIAVADVDGDGRLDFAVANQWQPSFFYHNISPDPGYCLELRLLLPLESGQTRVQEVTPTHPGRIAIGATATIYMSGKILIAQVDGGNGHSGKSAPEIHFGLGKSKHDGNLVDIELTWRDPDGNVHTAFQKNVSIGRPGHPGEEFRHTLLLPWPRQNDEYAQQFSQ